jgi:hypothetical protein
MRISTIKTKTMASQGKNHIQCKIVIDNKTIEQMSSFKYLGFNISYCLKEDINTENVQNNMKNTETKNFAKQQLKFYKIMAVPMLTYASENWTINRSDKKKKQSQLK